MFSFNFRFWVIPLIFLSGHLAFAAPMGFEGLNLMRWLL